MRDSGKNDGNEQSVDVEHEEYVAVLNEMPTVELLSMVEQVLSSSDSRDEPFLKAARDVIARRKK